ncbi:MAG: adenylate/guanylate cyclase domain-containing protein [Actinomycetota bacterium]
MHELSRKTVTVLFSDVVDSTPLGERLDPESVRALMSRYFDAMSAVIERHGGTVEKYVGDAIMAVFGIPQVHEDDALRAVRAAAEMREALAALNRELPQHLSARAALNTGEVVAGGGHTLVTGDAVNVAKRLEEAAEGGEILIGASTYALVGNAVLAEQLAPLVVKGKANEVEAWRVTAVLPGTLGRARRFDADLVGRAGELALLRQAQARAVGTRSCYLFTVLGAAGAGKSRLAKELLAELAEEATVIVGRCLPYGEGITFWPLRDVLHAVGDLGALVDGRDAAVLAAAAGAGDAPAQPEETARALRRLVEALARERPVVLVFEDIHWAEAAFLDLLDHLAAATRDAQVLLLCLARPELLEDRPGWAGGRLNATTILLEPLDAEDSDQLVENLAGDALAPGARRTITEVAEGNPLFLEEMVAMMVDDGRTDAVPPTIHALLSARLERLPPAEREVLAAASVAGRFFATAAVQALAGDDAVDRLVALERKELIRPQRVSFTDDGAYRFRHILIRDAAYDALPKSRRAELHERLADWLEATAGARRRELEELVGYHLERAHALAADLGTARPDLSARARVLLTASGQRALDGGDAPAAIALLRRSLALPGPRDAPRGEALLALALALQDAGDFPGADNVLDRGRALADELADPQLEARMLVEQSFLQFHTQPKQWVEEALPTAERAIAALEATADDTGLARAWMLVVLFDYIRCRSDNLERALEFALRYAEQAHDRRGVSFGLMISVRATPFASLPVPDALIECERLAARDPSNSILTAVVHGVRALLLAMAGRFDEARAAHRTGQALLEEFGLTRLLAVQGVYAGSVELLADDPVAAERELRASLTALESIGDTGTLATAAALLAQALGAQGRYAEAGELAARSEGATSTADVISQVFWRVAKATAHPDDPEAAAAIAAEALAIAETTQSVTLQAEALACVSETLAAAGRAAEAGVAARRALALYEAKGHVVGAAQVRASAAAQA